MGAIQTFPVVIDTNVLVSGLLFGGSPGKLVELWKKGHIRPYMTQEMIDEVIRVLAYPKFQLTESEIHYLLYVELLPFFEIVVAATGPVIVESDPGDDIFLRGAEAAGARFVITGDKHLLSVRTYKNIAILTPTQFLQRLPGAR